MVFIRRTHWFNERYWTHLIFASSCRITIYVVVCTKTTTYICTCSEQKNCTTSKVLSTAKDATKVNEIPRDVETITHHVTIQIVGDYHNLIWLLIDGHRSILEVRSQSGSKYLNDRGESIYNLFLNSGLWIWNVGNMPIFQLRDR